MAESCFCVKIYVWVVGKSKFGGLIEANFVIKFCFDSFFTFFW